MDIISAILAFLAGFFIVSTIISIVILIALILLLIFLFKQARKHPRGVLIGLITILIISAIGGLISFETIIGGITGASGVLGSMGVLISRWKYLKKSFK